MTFLDKRTLGLTPDDWADLWLRYKREHRDGDFWAVDSMFFLPSEDPERAWLVILALVSRAEEEELGYIGAGPLENLVEEHAPAFVDRIEAAALTDTKFQEALSAIWLNSLYQQPEIVARLVAASGEAIEPFELDYEKAEREEREGKDGA
jgi:hypothetical protein